MIPTGNKERDEYDMSGDLLFYASHHTRGIQRWTFCAERILLLFILKLSFRLSFESRTLIRNGMFVFVILLVLKLE